MLRINWEIVPFGEEERKYFIGVMEIGNVGSQYDVANYVVRLDGENIGKVKTFRREHGAWDLVRSAIELLPAERRAKSSILGPGNSRNFQSVFGESPEGRRPLANSTGVMSPSDSWGRFSFPDKFLRIFSHLVQTVEDKVQNSFPIYSVAALNIRV